MGENRSLEIWFDCLDAMKTYPVNNNLMVEPIGKGDLITADFLNKLVCLCLQNRIHAGSGITIAGQSISGGTTISANIPAVNIFPVRLLQVGGSSGGDKSDCSFTYTATKPDGTILMSNATPLNSLFRFPGVAYYAATFGIGFYFADSAYFVTLDEQWKNEQLYLRPNETDGYKVNADAKNGYLELTNADESSQISLDLTSGTGKNVFIRLSDLPASAVAQFREVTVCVDGVEKTAYILMTEPV